MVEAVEVVKVGVDPVGTKSQLQPEKILQAPRTQRAEKRQPGSLEA